MKIDKKEIQRILYSFANLKIDKASIEHNTLLELLKNHPEASDKIGSGVDYFYVQQSKWKKNQYNFMVSRIDGTSMDFSYLSCLNPKRKSTPISNWGNTFRNIVKDQTDSFRVAAFDVVGVGDNFVCSQTGLKFSKMYAHVDHVYPLTFDSIFTEFIELNRIDLSKVELSTDAGTSEAQEIVDENLVKLFSNFHKKRAVLRIVCSSANMQAKRTKNYNNLDPIKSKKKLLKLYPQYHINN